MDNKIMKQLKEINGRNKTHCNFCGEEFKKFKQGHDIKIFLSKQWACGSCYSKAIEEQMERESVGKSLPAQKKCSCERCKEHERSKREMSVFMNHVLREVV
tara:strand:- start:649 stop:951 length:303 start_codon:yes stop_codon:yes gene_type:complete